MPQQPSDLCSNLGELSRQLKSLEAIRAPLPPDRDLDRIIESFKELVAWQVSIEVQWQDAIESGEFPSFGHAPGAAAVLSRTREELLNNMRTVCMVLLEIRWDVAGGMRFLEAKRQSELGLCARTMRRAVEVLQVRAELGFPEAGPPRPIRRGRRRPRRESRGRFSGPGGPIEGD